MGCESLPPRFTYGYPKQPTKVKEMKELVDENQGGAFAPCYARLLSGWANTSEDDARILREVLIHSQEIVFPHVVLADYVEYIRERIADLRGNDAQRKIAFAIRGGKGVVVVKP
ncbi:hypothetical protein FPANT_5213 [Fusarium pseudoanthophilum]|uniref:Uncharacterized protein n=1 Tax=Fusarium pseudoanthophilum TaxID=48495 RepID=A0A8H5PAT8_9HYPO|nr:hypothetical protein FPANT_5213 [Fusarium pseudoanthophilum]